MSLRQITKKCLLTLILGLVSQTGISKDYIIYQPDWGPLQKDTKAHQQWRVLTEQHKAHGMTQENIEARLAVLDPVVAKNPNWPDGHWLLANTLMEMGETLAADDEKSTQKVRKLLVKAQNESEKCLKFKKDLALCKFFLGAALGKIATIDGVIASLSKGERILDLWNAVYTSEQEYIFEDGYSLQGLVRYALGIFYRVVPDVFLLRWFFGFSGDIDKSIEMHRESLKFAGGKAACSQLMYAISMLCKTDGDKDETLTGQAFTVLDRVSSIKTASESSLICVKDAGKIKQNPGNACGYTKAKQQEVDEKAISKKLEAKK